MAAMAGKDDARGVVRNTVWGRISRRLRRGLLLLCVAIVGIAACSVGGFMEYGSSAAGKGEEEGVSLKETYASKKAGTVVETAGSSRKEQQGMFYQSKITKKVFARMKGKSYKKGCIVPKEELRYLRMLYVGFDGKAHIGEMVVNRKIAADVLEIFYKLYLKKYPIQRMVLIDEYNGDDDKSMEANNTSCFNYRVVKGTTSLSKHSYGLAIDVNPLYNPYIHTMNGKTVCEPAGSKKYSDRSKDFPYKITRKDKCFKLFTRHGFSWGGDWNTKKDYQHFQKS